MNITLTDRERDIYLMLDFFGTVLELKEIRLSCINIDGQGLHFDRIHSQRPTSVKWGRSKLDNEEWVGVNKFHEYDGRESSTLKLSKEAGDDISYWLNLITYYEDARGKAWVYPDDVDVYDREDDNDAEN